MRLIRPAPATESAPLWRRPAGVAIGFVVVGLLAVLVVVLAPRGADRSVAGLAAAAGGLAIGVGLAIGWRGYRGRGPSPADDDLARLLGPLFDDSYVLVASPQLPIRAPDLAALLVGPPGVRVILARAWDGHYRLAGKRWEYDTRSRRGWIACRTNPTWEASRVREAVVRWARDAGLDANLPIEPAVVFPRRESHVALEEPAIEVVTQDNAPWWAGRIGRTQRLDAARVDRFVRAVVDAGRTPATPTSPPAAIPEQR
jgi:hypothetical protein